MDALLIFKILFICVFFVIEYFKYTILAVFKVFSTILLTKDMPIVCFHGYSKIVFQTGSNKLHCCCFPSPLRTHCTGAAPSVPVCVSQDTVVHSGVSQGDLGQDQGAGLSVFGDVQRGHPICHIVVQTMNQVLWTLVGNLSIPRYVLRSTDCGVITGQVHRFFFRSLHWVWLCGLRISQYTWGIEKQSISSGLSNQGMPKGQVHKHCQNSHLWLCPVLENFHVCCTGQDKYY